MKTLYTACAILSAAIACAGEVNLSLLDNTEELASALSLLQSNGCSQSAISSFSNAVTSYYRTPIDLDLSAFPKPVNGVFTFPAMSNLVAALSRPLWKSDHPFETTCFFVITALSQATTDIPADALFGPFLAVINRDDFSWQLCPVATPREAFLACYGPAYSTYLARLTGAPPTDRDLSIMAALHTCTIIPRYTTQENLPEYLLATLRSKWSRLRIQFSPASRIVLLHGVDLTSQFRVITDHGGVLISHESSYTYFEKAGGSGPFIRLDLDSLDDLTSYLECYISDAKSRGDMTAFLLTYDDKEVKWIWPEQ